MADSTFNGVKLYIRRDAQGRMPLPEPVGTPVIRTPNLSGGSNVQTGGYRGRAVTLPFDFPSYVQYDALRALIGLSSSLILKPGALTFTYANTTLETISAPLLGRDGSVSASARFTMDGY